MRKLIVVVSLLLAVHLALLFTRRSAQAEGKGKQNSKVQIGIVLDVGGRGDKAFNEKLGLERAQAVERYLYEQYQVPLHKMNVISYGEDKPIAPNKTKAGRAQNRRVVIKVLA